MEKSELFRIILNKDKWYKATVVEFVFDRLRAVLGDSSIYNEKEKNKLRTTEHKWLLDMEDNINIPATPIMHKNKVIGIHYVNGVEVGINFYYDVSISYRVPLPYTVGSFGIRNNSIKIANNLVYPVGVLIVGDGRFPTYARFKNHQLNLTYIEDVNKTTCSVKSKRGLYREFVYKFIEVNSYSPGTIKVIKF